MMVMMLGKHESMTAFPHASSSVMALVVQTIAGSHFMVSAVLVVGTKFTNRLLLVLLQRTLSLWDTQEGNGVKDIAIGTVPMLGSRWMAAEEESLLAQAFGVECISGTLLTKRMFVAQIVIGWLQT
jgi:hypothetical protein